MNKIFNLANTALVVILVLVLSFCSKEDTYFEEYEKNWKTCYDENFHFEKDSVQLDGDYIRCELDNQDVLINAENSEYSSITYHGSSGTVTSPDVTFSIDTGTRYTIWIALFKPSLLTGFCIQLDYPKDSLNYYIQKTFGKDKIQFSSNFINNGVEYIIGTSCIPNGRITFSTIYSTRVNQELKIDHFIATLQDDKWYYHLEYSADDLELTNEGWNSRSKIDEYGHRRKSKVLIENLPVRNLHGVIDFAFPKEE